MKKLFVSMIVASLAGCHNPNDTRYKPTFESRERQKYSRMTVSKVARKLKKEKQLIPCGTGGSTSDGVKMLAISFDYRIPMNIEEGRKLLVASVQELITAVNEEERIRPYLTNYPFDAKNVEISIFIQNADGSKLSPSLQVLSAHDGMLRYKIDNPKGPLFIILLEETYEEALQKLEKAETTGEN